MKKVNEECVSEVLRVLERGRLFRYDVAEPYESDVTRLEHTFARLIGRRFCVAVNSCSSGLLVALLAAGLEPGDQVLVPAFTFVAVPSAVFRAGGIAKLVDMTDDLVIDIDDLVRKIRGAKFLILSYMRGRVPNLDRVLDVCESSGVTLIEDAAHSLGVNWCGQPTGQRGKAAVFSTQSYKLIDSGEGGLVVTDDEELVVRCAAYSGCYEKNWLKHGWPIDPGIAVSIIRGLPVYNFRMTNLTAAVILPQLLNIEARVARYARNYFQLERHLRQSVLLRFPSFTEGTRPVLDSMQFFLNDLEPSQMRNFEREARVRGVDLALLGASEDNARCFWNWDFVDGSQCARTRRILASLVDLRLSLQMEERDVHQLGVNILEALGSV